MYFNMQSVYQFQREHWTALLLEADTNVKFLSHLKCHTVCWLILLLSLNTLYHPIHTETAVEVFPQFKPCSDTCFSQFLTYFLELQLFTLFHNSYLFNLLWEILGMKSRGKAKNCTEMGSYFLLINWEFQNSSSTPPMNYY